MKTFKLTVNEDELKALIRYHAIEMEVKFDTETSERIHALTKRLNRDTPEIEGDPRPKETLQELLAQNEVNKSNNIKKENNEW